MFLKNIFLLLSLMVSFTVLMGQQTNPTGPLTKADYLKKSKTQKIIAFSLLGGGSIAWIAGASKYMNQGDNVDGGGEAAMIVGGLAALGSVPFFIMASKNKKKAIRMSISTQKIPRLQNGYFVYQAIPSLNLKISL